MPRSLPGSLLLRLYLAASRRGGGVARRALERRQAAGKEDGARLGERMGEAGLPRPEGRLVWFHAASVGEAASLIELLRRLQQARPELRCLVTTVTVTSAQFLLDSESQLREAIQKMLRPPAVPGEHAAHAPQAVPSELTAATAPTQTAYVCPMPEHVSILYGAPGKCPICGMTLVETTVTAFPSPAPSSTPDASHAEGNH